MCKVSTEKFSSALKRFRNSLGFNQKELAEELKMKPPLYQRYESGKTTPSIEFIYTLANKYHVSADYLLGLSDEPRPVHYDENEIQEAFKIRDLFRSSLAQVAAKAQAPQVVE